MCTILSIHFLVKSDFMIETIDFFASQIFSNPWCHMGICQARGLFHSKRGIVNESIDDFIRSAEFESLRIVLASS